VASELEFHLARETEENIARGMSPKNAAAAARAEFGSLAATAEECYEARGTVWIDQLVQDCRFGTRSLIRHRSFATVTIMTLALGIGASTAVFSLADAALLRSLPYNKPDQLVYLSTPSRQLLARGIPANVFTPSFADFSDLRRENHSFSSMTQYQQTSMNLAAGGTVERVGAARVDGEFFKTLEIWPELGRGFEANDDKAGSSRVAVISHALWQSLFDGSRTALDRNVTLDGTTYRVVGVMPEGFEFPRTDDIPTGNGEFDRTQIWVPMVLPSGLAMCRSWCGTFGLGRLRSGMSPFVAQRELTALMAHLNPLHQAPLNDLIASVEPLRNAVIGPVRPLMRLLLAAVGLVMLIASANAAGLLLTRAAERTHELGVRAALGAQRKRLFHQIMTESLLLCLAAGLIGTGIAWLLLHGVVALHPRDIPRLQNAAINPDALAVIAAITIFLALLVGAVPSILASRVNLCAFLASAGTRGVLGSRQKARRILSTAQIAVVVVLLTAAGLLLRSYLKVLASPDGYSLSTLSANLQFSSGLNGAPVNPRYDTPEKRREFFTEILNRLRHAPGVEAAGVVDVLPLTGAVLETNFEVEGHPAERNPMVEIRHASPDWFTSMRIPLLVGRDFAPTDGPDSDAVAIVNRRFAATYLGGKRAIGAHIRLSSTSPWMTVVGVIGDARIYRPEDAPDLQIFACLWQADVSGGYLTLRSHLPLQTAGAEIHTIVQSFDPDIAVADVHTLGDLESQATARRRFQTALMAAFAVMALALALVGIYGLLAYSVRQRTAEIGVRIAMGSSRMRVMNLVLREGLTLLVVGLVIGMAGALAATRLLSGFLYGIPSLDPMTYVFVPCLLLLGTLTACIVPSIRAARIDPMRALRRE
jgi:putative ABC transport system permease protein